MVVLGIRVTLMQRPKVHLRFLNFQRDSPRTINRWFSMVMYKTNTTYENTEVFLKHMSFIQFWRICALQPRPVVLAANSGFSRKQMMHDNMLTIWIHNLGTQVSKTMWQGACSQVSVAQRSEKGSTDMTECADLLEVSILTAMRGWTALHIPRNFWAAVLSNTT